MLRSLMLSVFILSLLAGTRLMAAPVIDGDFTDWQSIPTTAMDGFGDHGGAIADLIELRMTNDTQFLYLYLSTLQSANLTGFNQTQVFFDTDLTTTGFVIAGRLGSDLMLRSGSGFDQRGGSFGGPVVPVSIASAASADNRLFEYRIPLNVTYPSDSSPVFTSDTFRMLIAVEDSGGNQTELLPNSGTILYTLNNDEPTTGPEPGVLNYVVPMISTDEAPNPTNTTFEAIYSNSGQHMAVGGADWKDYALRGLQPGAGIGEPIASISRAWFLTDAEKLYFGMVVYDPATAQMTPDSGDNTGTKPQVESVTVGLAAQTGTIGEIGEVLWFAFDAFGNRDIPQDGGFDVIDADLIRSTSYLLTQNRWAVEFSVPIAALVDASDLPVNPFVWSAVVGYRSPEPGPRVPWYNAAHGNGLEKFHMTLNLPINNAASDAWLWVE